MNEFLMAFIGFVAGAAVGIFTGWLLMRDHGSRLRIAQENRTLRHEMDRYRDRVDQHFTRTAELVNNMTQAYRAVHEELASGAQALCSEDTQHLAVVEGTLPELQGVANPAHAAAPAGAEATPAASGGTAQSAPNHEPTGTDDPTQP